MGTSSDPLDSSAGDCEVTAPCYATVGLSDGGLKGRARCGESDAGSGDHSLFVSHSG